MEALLDASDSQVALLDEIVSSVQAIEQTLSGVLAARDGMLALASRLAMSIAEEGGGVDAAELTARTVAAELAAALRVSDRTVQRRMADADWVVNRFPQVWAAQGSGRISAGHARVIVDAGSHLEDPFDRAAYAERVLEFADDESPNRLRPIARRLAEQYQPVSIDERHRTATKKRGVWLKDLEDGVSKLEGIFPSETAHGMLDRLTGMAVALKKHNVRETAEARAAGAVIIRDEEADAGESAPVVFDGSASGPAADAAHGSRSDTVAAELTEQQVFVPDERTVAQLRADLLTDLVLTGAPSGHDTPDGLLSRITAHVEVTVPVFTLMGLDSAALAGTEFTPDLPGGRLPAAELDGSVPITLDVARRLAGAASAWEPVLTHPITGAMLAVDRYRPSARLRRHLKARDQRCRFVTCGRPAKECDLDHNEAASTGGATCEHNLADFCRRHHVLKHHSPWHVEQIGAGRLKWTSPTGRVYIDHPPPQNTVSFRRADLGPPGREDLWAAVPACEFAPF